jgi:G3E family GTPase
VKSADILYLCKSDPNSIVDHIKSLESQIKELNEKLKFLEARLNQNSQNSSKPPSTDVFMDKKPKPKSTRTISGKKAGGQKGHPGRTLEMVENPD